MAERYEKAPSQRLRYQPVHVVETSANGALHKWCSSHTLLKALLTNTSNAHPAGAHQPECRLATRPIEAGVCDQRNGRMLIVGQRQAIADMSLSGQKQTHARTTILPTQKLETNRQSSTGSRRKRSSASFAFAEESSAATTAREHARCGMALRLPNQAEPGNPTCHPECRARPELDLQAPHCRSS